MHLVLNHGNLGHIKSNIFMTIFHQHTFVTPVDITTNVITIENMTDVGTGEVNTCT